MYLFSLNQHILPQAYSHFLYRKIIDGTKSQLKNFTEPNKHLASTELCSYSPFLVLLRPPHFCDNWLGDCQHMTELELCSKTEMKRHRFSSLVLPLPCTALSFACLPDTLSLPSVEMPAFMAQPVIINLSRIIRVVAASLCVSVHECMWTSG